MAAETHEDQVHHVRIFVVPDAALRGDAPPVGGSQRVTPRHLESAHAHVMQTERGLVKDVHAIIVIGDQAATFLNGTLVPHDDAIKHAAIRVYTESDVIEWECNKAFAIDSTKKADNPIWQKDGTPGNPFYSGPPFDGERLTDTRFLARSSKTRAEANDQQYKVFIKIKIESGDRLIDPDYVCGNPPPP